MTSDFGAIEKSARAAIENGELRSFGSRIGVVTNAVFGGSIRKRSFLLKRAEVAEE